MILKQFDAFPNLQHPRILFIKGSEIKTDIITKLRIKIGQKLKQSGFKLESRPWKIHLTLARNKNQEKIKLIKLNTLPKFKIKQIDLMHSILSRKGSQYEISQSFKLK